MCVAMCSRIIMSRTLWMSFIAGLSNVVSMFFVERGQMLMSLKVRGQRLRSWLIFIALYSLYTQALNVDYAWFTVPLFICRCKQLTDHTKGILQLMQLIKPKSWKASHIILVPHRWLSGHGCDNWMNCGLLWKGKMKELLHHIYVLFISLSCCKCGIGIKWRVECSAKWEVLYIISWCAYFYLQNCFKGILSSPVHENCCIQYFGKWWDIDIGVIPYEIILWINAY